MVDGPLSKSELLAAARTMLKQDDRERWEESLRLRRNETLIAVAMGLVFLVSAGSFIVSCHGHHADAIHSAGTPATEGPQK